MTDRTTPLQQCRNYLRALSTYRWLWIVPTVAMTFLAGFYAITKGTKWQASQAFVVRDEAAGGFGHQGRFDSTEALKSFQETILELARNRKGVATALKKLGPPNGKPKKNWPTQGDVEDLQDAITVSAPRGGEFGKTEVIYLSVTGKTKDDALRRTEVIYTQMEARLADLRNKKASSLVKETTERLAVAQSELDAAITRLAETEKKVGSDLGELRILNDSGSGDSNLRSALNQLKIELRQATADVEASEHNEAMLVAANEDPENLLATSNRLFEAQPALRQLKEGLLSAQLRTAELMGKMTEAHPLVQSARDTEAEVRRDFHAELASALRGVRSDLQVKRRLVESLQAQHDATSERLLKLAELRARYGNLVADVRQHTELVEKAQQDLAAARASKAAASASLISRFDEPVVGSSPIGPSRTVIVGAGLLGGLLTGLGLVFLAMPSQSGQGRRWTDYIGYGRRSTDRQTGRRGDDSVGQPAASGMARRASDGPQRGRRADDQFPQEQLRRAEDRATPIQQPNAVTESPTTDAIAANETVKPNVGRDDKPEASEDVPVVKGGIEQTEETSPKSNLDNLAETPAEPAESNEVIQAKPPEPVPVPSISTNSKRSLLASCLSELDRG